MPPVVCLKTAVRQPPPAAVGLTQASSVMPIVRSSEALSGTVTKLELPLNDSAPPKRPIGAQPVAVVVPVLPVPDASATVVPAPSLNPYAATWPGAACAGVAASIIITTAHSNAPPGRTTRSIDVPCPSI